MTDINARAASFRIDGVFFELIPARMAQSPDGTFRQTLPGGLTAILECKEPEPGLCFQRLRFVHDGTKCSGLLSEIRSFDRLLPAGQTAVYESLTGDDCSATSFFSRKEELNNDSCFSAAPKGGRPADADAFPFFDLDTGRLCATFGIGWTGEWLLSLEKTENALRVLIGLRDVKTVLYPGEEIRTASVLWVTGETVEESRRLFRRAMLRHFSPREPVTGGFLKLPIAEQNYDRYFGKREDWATVAGQRRCADIAAACEMDTLWLDAAWFDGGFPNGVGNFGYAPGFPNGTGEVSAYAHEKGLKYLQWFEPERVNAYSDTLREFREDVILPKNRGSVNCLLNIGDPDVWERLSAFIKTHIRNDGVDIYREDFNIRPEGYWETADAPGRRGMTEIRYTEALYDFWDGLLEEFPGLLIDNCASGGRRIDLETSMRSVPLWRSDIACFPESEEHRPCEWSQNQILGLTRYLPYHASGTQEFSAYAVRSVATGGAALNFDVFSPDFDPSAVRPIVREIRSLQKYWAGDFYPLTKPSNSDNVWISWQLALAGSGVVYAFRRAGCEKPDFAPGIMCIESDAEYDVAVTDEDMQKTELRLKGDALRGFAFICKNRRSSVILEYARID